VINSQQGSSPDLNLTYFIRKENPISTLCLRQQIVEGIAKYVTENQFVYVVLSFLMV